MPDKDRELVPHITRWIPIVSEILVTVPMPLALVMAIIHTESSGWPDVSRREPGGNTSWGLMGICTRTAAWMSSYNGRIALAKKGIPDRVMNLIPLLPGADILKNPIPNLSYGIVYLYYQYLRYKSYTKAIAAYNAGHVKLRNGKYINQKYVDRVMSLYQVYLEYLKEKEVK